MPAPAQNSEDAGACTLVWEVLVLESDTGEAIPNAQLALRAPANPSSPRLRTEAFLHTRADGRARVTGLCPGPLQVTVSKAEHDSRRVHLELSAATTESLVELDALHGHHDERVIVVHDDSDPTLAASESLSGAELSRRRGAGLADVLTGISGVSTLRGTAGGLGKPIIRGQFGRRNMIVFDQIRHEGQEWGIDHAPEVDPQAADRVTVIKGAGTTRFGPEAAGGVVLLEPRPLPRTPSLRGEVGGFGYSNPLGGGGSFRLDYAPKRGKGLATRVEGNLARHRSALTPDYPLDNTGSLTWNVGARIGYISESIDVEVGYHLMRQQLGICTCLQISTAEEFQRSVALGQPVAVDAYRADFELERPRQEIWHHLALARTRVALGHAGELHATYSYQFNDRQEFAIVRESVVGPQLDFGLATHSLDLRYEHAAVDLRRWTLVGALGAGLTQQRNEFESTASLVPDYEQWGWSVYDIERFVHDRVEIEFGARYEGLHRSAALAERDYLGQQAGGRIDAEACEPTADNGGTCKHLFNTASATFGVLGRPIRRARDFTIRGQLNSSARIPAIDEHFMNGAAPSFPMLGLGDSRLGVERTWGGELSVQYAGAWWFVEAAAFSSFVDDYIYFVAEQQEGQCAPLTCTTRGPFPVFVFQPTNALFNGGEVRFDLQAPRIPFALAGSAAWVRGHDLEAAGPLAFMPADRYSLTGRYLFPDSRLTTRAYLELGGTVVTRQTRYQPELDFAPPPPAYVLLGAGAGVEFLGEREIYRLSVTGTNLLNMRYRDFNSLLRYFADEPGWGLQLRFAVDFDVALGS
ncbi:TonB-dependent receptor [Enhygromyxa salina]|uniref:TonB-dependent Receptor Plug Domain protein n=1 Tax=Enhygromyxa salina TaxID=215803 RepID=A0A2S9YSW4_9BACT|nr:TonB-dependent receptor [Enhygromyxa salina]PRQ08176.1 TonB-dependent Receptor Plug Domain protein [Enhygromyxa salina]